MCANLYIWYYFLILQIAIIINFSLLLIANYLRAIFGCFLIKFEPQFPFVFIEFLAPICMFLNLISLRLVKKFAFRIKLCFLDFQLIAFPHFLIK